MQLEPNLTEDNVDEYKTIKKDLEEIYNERARGLHIRSKAKLVEESEQNLKYFSKLEVKNSNSKYIKTLLHNDTLITHPEEILDTQKQYYSKLYTQSKDSIIDPDIFNTIEIPQLSEMEKEICEKEITIEEVGQGLKDLANNKTPGTDGLTSEFYKFFWPKIKTLVFDSISYAFHSNSLSIEHTCTC